MRHFDNFIGMFTNVKSSVKAKRCAACDHAIVCIYNIW